MVKKVLGQGRIIKIGQHHDQGPPAQMKAEAGCKLPEIGRNVGGLEPIEGVAQDTEMRLSGTKLNQ